MKTKKYIHDNYTGEKKGWNMIYNAYIIVKTVKKNKKKLQTEVK